MRAVNHRPRKHKTKPSRNTVNRASLDFWLHDMGVPVESIDPTNAEVVAALRTKFTPEQIKMFFILRQMTEYGRILKPTDSPEQYPRDAVNSFGKIPGLDVPPRSVEELDSSFRARFSGLGSYKDANPDWFDPVTTKTIFNKISRASSDFRDKHMVILLSNVVCEQKRVFAVVGASHVVCKSKRLENSWPRSVLAETGHECVASAILPSHVRW